MALLAGCAVPRIHPGLEDGLDGVKSRELPESPPLLIPGQEEGWDSWCPWDTEGAAGLGWAAEPPLPVEQLGIDPVPPEGPRSLARGARSKVQCSQDAMHTGVVVLTGRTQGGVVLKGCTQGGAFLTACTVHSELHYSG